MNYLHDIAALIQIRDFLQSSLDNLGVSLSPAQVNDVRKRITFFDQIIINKSLSLDIDRTRLTDKGVIEYSYTSTEDTEDVLNKLLSSSKPSGKKVKSVKSDEAAK